ncbi:hypothetical protein ACFY2K_42645 [Kitasatospora sp. NPDC001309]|uniref:hypothetical protein n=1 Tax=Kitasatospora sp. NPDC001309 TaxID=3364013 RepID=UPI003696F662
MSYAGGGTPVPKPLPQPLPAPKLSFAAARRLWFAAVLLFAVAGAGAAGAVAEHFDAPFWVELVAAELTAAVVVFASPTLTETEDDDPVFEAQEEAAAAHWAGTCGCGSPMVMLADCDRWNDALLLAIETEEGAR